MKKKRKILIYKTRKQLPRNKQFLKCELHDEFKVRSSENDKRNSCISCIGY